MNCVEARENLSAYIDCELKQDASCELKEHLDKCDECRREYDELTETAYALRTLPDEALPENFDEILRVAINREKLKKIEDSRKRRKILSGIAAVFVIGFFSVTMYNQTDVAAPTDEMALAFDTVNESENLAAVDEPDAVENETVYGSIDIAAQVRVKSEQNYDSGAEPEQYRYLKLIEDEFLDAEVELIDCSVDTDGVWRFKIKVNTELEYEGSAGDIYIYFGQDGEIWREESSSSMETVY